MDIFGANGGGTNGTPKRKSKANQVKIFLRALADTANIVASCRIAKLRKENVFRWYKRHPVFATAMDAALQQGVSTLEMEALRRARDGVKEPVYHNGKRCGSVRRFSDVLLIFLLKAHKPAVYRESKSEVHHTGGATLNLQVVEKLRKVEDDGQLNGSPGNRALPAPD